MRLRLGTKILLVTLAIALGLAGAIIWVVSRDLTRLETDRARREIDAAVTGYLAATERLHAAVEGVVRLLMEDPTLRAQLEQVDAGGEPGMLAATQFRDEIFGRVIQTELSRRYTPPAFQVLVSRDGRTAVATAGEDAALAKVLDSGSVEWPHRMVLDRPRDLARRYLWLDGRLFLAMGVPLRTELGEDAPPTHAYFIGYRIDDEWTARLLRGVDRREARHATTTATVAHGSSPTATDGTPAAAIALAESAVPADPGPTPPQTDGVAAQAIRTPASNGPALRAWFFVAGQVVARSGGSGANGTDADRARERAAWEAAERVGVCRPDDADRGTDHPPVPVDFTVGGERFVGEGVAFPPAPGSTGALVVASSLTAALADLHRLQRTLALVTATAAVLAVVAFRIVSERIAKPVRALVAGTRRIAKGEFDEPVTLDRSDELGELAASFNDMAAGLRQRDMIKDVFGKFVDPRIAEQFVADGSRLMPGGDRRVQSILFSDLENFTGASERLTPEDLVHLINTYFGDASDVIAASGGVVDKYIGDAVVAFWGPPFVDDHAARACRAALGLVRAAALRAGDCAALGIPPLAVRVGIATGEVLVGLIGSANRYNYTVMGDVANLGSRLEGLNKFYKTRVLVTERTAREAAGAVLCRRVDRVRVAGRAEATGIYEVLAEPDEPDSSRAERLRDRYEAALAVYESGDWPAARAAFDAVARELVDPTARIMAERCAAFIDDGPPADWDGVWVLGSK